jgi:hypothetical protein
MTVTLLLASALLAQSTPAAPAQAATGANTSTITASAPRIHSYGWLTTAGPDAEGRYMAWIKLSDLDPATATGNAAVTARMRRAAVVLCDISAEQPQVPGYFNRGERDCLRNTMDQASAKARGVADAAREGRPVAMIGVTTTAVR